MIEAVARLADDLGPRPHVRPEVHEQLVIVSEVFLVILIKFVLLMYVYCYDDGSCRDLRWSIVEEYMMTQLVLAYLLREEADLAHLVVVENP